MAEAFDGLAEADAILERGKTLVGGRVSEGIPDDSVLELMDDGSGRVKPFIGVLFGEPIPVLRDRTIMGEREQPHLLPISFVTVAADATTARTVSAALLRLYEDWQPSPSASGMVPAGGYQFGTKSTETKPGQYTRVRQMTTIINLAGSAA